MKLQLKTVEVSVRELLDVDAALGEMSARKDLPAATAFAVALLTKKLLPELQSAKERQVEIFMACGGVQRGGQIQVPENRFGELAEQLTPLLAQAVEVQAPRLALPMFAGLTFSPQVILALMPFMEEE